MRGATHLLFGLLLAAIATETYSFPRPLLAVLLIIIGSLLPDIDEKTSLLGRRLPIIGWLSKHRGFFHGVLFLTGTVIALSVVMEWPYLAAFGGAFLLHLGLDALTPRGVEPFWPSKVRIRGLVRVGSALEKLIFLSAAAVFVWLLLR